MTRKDGWRVLVVCLVLGLGTVALYSPAFGFNFVNYDDELYVNGNIHINKGLSGVLEWAFSAGYGNVWQPLTWLSHALDCQIYGLKPGGHHVTNIILHALNAVLVFLVLRQLTGAFWRSAAVAAFFAWHPLHVEVFAWVAERKMLLGAFFSLTALWIYSLYAEKSRSQLPSAKFYYIAAVILFALAVMSNLAAAMLPFLLLALDWWPLQRLTATESRPVAKQALFLLAEKAPFFILALCAVVVTIKATAGLQVADPIAQLPYRIRVATAGMTCFRYLAKSFWPTDLAPAYPFVLHYAKWQLIGVALALVAITIVAVVTRKTRPYWLVGWLWFLITLVPALNLVQSGAQPMADRYMYIPSIGLWMLFCWEAVDLMGTLPSARLVLRGVGAVLLVVCGIASAIQLRVWKSEGTLLARIPDSNVNAVGHADYASYLMRYHDLPHAEIEAEKAAAISPDRPAFLLLLGQIYLVEHKADQSIEKLQSALRLERGMDIARLELGQAFLEKGRASDAAEEFKSVLQRDPKNFVAHHWLARALLAQGRTAEAVGEYSASLISQPGQPITLNDLAWLLATDPHREIRRGSEAVKLADRACELTHWQEPALIGTLAAAYAEAGDFDKAVLASQKAHDLAAAQGLRDLAETNLQLITLYREHKPFHATK